MKHKTVESGMNIFTLKREEAQAQIKNEEYKCRKWDEEGLQCP